MITLTTDPRGTRWTCDDCGVSEVEPYEEWARQAKRGHVCGLEALRAKRRGGAA